MLEALGLCRVVELLQPLGEELTLGEGLEVLVTLALELALEKLLPVRVPEAQREELGDFEAVELVLGQ